MADAPSAAPQVIRFGTFEVDLRSGELRKAGVRVALQDQPFRILTMMLARPGEIVTREALRQTLWPADTFVDFEHGLNAAVRRLREALGDDAETPRFVETVPRRGYRFIAPVDDPRRTPAPADAPAARVAPGRCLDRTRPSGRRRPGGRLGHSRDAAPDRD